MTKPIDFEDLETTVRKTWRELNALRESRDTRRQLDALQAELGVAARIQQSLLPHPAVTHRGLEIAAAMMPARHVSGDFYDYFVLDESRHGIVIGDVSGKGIPSALFMAVARTVLRSSALQGASPADCLAAVNKVLVPQGAGEMYVTLFYGIVDMEHARLTWSVGGHSAPWVVRRDGSVGQLEGPRGFMVGMFEEATFDSTEAPLAQGDLILVHTDGVSDAENAEGDLLGRDRFAALMNALRPESPSAAVDHIVRSVQEFTRETPQADDITLLAARWSNPSGDASG